jgi:hypothetical protein
MTIRHSLALAGVVAALAVAGCSTASTGDRSPEPSTAGSGATVSAEQNKQRAQQLAEEAQKIMLDPGLPPREKYPKALGMFRDALKIDPGNALAQDGVKLIENVYESMGRPVPKAT